ncbi:GNAT family N-acetyltransferase [Aestuariivivens sediminicola]|uniref:GNAT family N-acetyltransferase n=1 Tax=Aestuariivivens sediminicola TaxID=2913560 RepID=UPI001F584F8D|nr:GNAT family N-acetyltransferase [Aestuariivivens sediminicola]
MIKLIRTDASHPDFINLVKQLNTYLRIVDGEDHKFYSQYNHIEAIKHVVLAYVEDKAVACGSFKPFDTNTVEIKRMFTLKAFRGQHFATLILNELELWAKALGYDQCILETGKRQVEAVAFYKKNKYQRISNFGPYKGVANSICYEKEL